MWNNKTLSVYNLNKMKTDNYIKSIQPPDNKLNQKLLSVHSILTDVESDACFEEIEDRKMETNLLRRPQFRINENSRRRFY